jgi:hypothetical protein
VLARGFAFSRSIRSLFWVDVVDSSSSAAAAAAAAAAAEIAHSARPAWSAKSQSSGDGRETDGREEYARSSFVRVGGVTATMLEIMHNYR